MPRFRNSPASSRERTPRVSRGFMRERRKPWPRVTRKRFNSLSIRRRRSLGESLLAMVAHPMPDPWRRLDPWDLSPTCARTPDRRCYGPVHQEESKAMKRTLAMLAVLALAATAQAQKPVTEAASVEAKATIVAIDHAKRLITLKGKEGEETVYAGPEVKRFDELKVGDVVTFRYYESLVLRIAKPGDPTP